MIAKKKKTKKNIKNQNNLNLSISFFTLDVITKPAYKENKDKDPIVLLASVESKDNGRGKDLNNDVNGIRKEIVERTAEIEVVDHDQRTEKSESIIETAAKDTDKVVRKNAVLRIQRSIRRNKRKTVQNHAKKITNRNIDWNILKKQ